jgi:hypothetical protein
MLKLATVGVLAGVATALTGVAARAYSSESDGFWSWIITGGAADAIWCGYIVAHELWPDRPGSEGDQSGSE